MSIQKLEGYMDCTLGKINKALREVRIKPISDISTDLLYVAYTKYQSDLNNIGLAASRPEHTQVFLKVERIRNNLLKELNRRGYSKDGYKYG